MVQWCYQVITKLLRSARRGVSLISVFNLTDGQIERRSDSRWTNWQTKWLTSGRMNQFRFPVKPWWGRGILRRQKKEKKKHCFVRRRGNWKPRDIWVYQAEAPFAIHHWSNQHLTKCRHHHRHNAAMGRVNFDLLVNSAKKKSPSLSSARLLLPHPLGSFWTTHFFFTTQPTPLLPPLLLLIRVMQS